MPEETVNLTSTVERLTELFVNMEHPRFDAACVDADRANRLVSEAEIRNVLQNDANAFCRWLGLPLTYGFRFIDGFILNLSK